MQPKKQDNRKNSAGLEMTGKWGGGGGGKNLKKERVGNIR